MNSFFTVLAIIYGVIAVVNWIFGSAAFIQQLNLDFHPRNAIHSFMCALSGIAAAAVPSALWPLAALGVAIKK